MTMTVVNALHGLKSPTTSDTHARTHARARTHVHDAFYNAVRCSSAGSTICELSAYDSLAVLVFRFSRQNPGLVRGESWPLAWQHGFFLPRIHKSFRSVAGPRVLPGEVAQTRQDPFCWYRRTKRGHDRAARLAWTRAEPRCFSQMWSRAVLHMNFAMLRLHVPEVAKHELIWLSPVTRLELGSTAWQTK